MYFGENQLAPGSIGISPLTTAHPLIFQHQSVRTFTWCHPSFILSMVRSPGFGSINTDDRPIQTRFRCGSEIVLLTWPVPISRRLILQQAHGHPISRAPIACRLTVSCSVSLPSRGSFHLSLAVLYAIGHAVVLSLTRWSSQIHTEFHVLRATRDTARPVHLSNTGLSPSMVRHSNASSRIPGPHCCPTTPTIEMIGLG